MPWFWIDYLYNKFAPLSSIALFLYRTMMCLYTDGGFSLCIIPFTVIVVSLNLTQAKFSFMSVLIWNSATASLSLFLCPSVYMYVCVHMHVNSSKKVFYSHTLPTWRFPKWLEIKKDSQDSLNNLGTSESCRDFESCLEQKGLYMFSMYIFPGCCLTMQGRYRAQAHKEYPWISNLAWLYYFSPCSG